MPPFPWAALLLLKRAAGKFLVVELNQYVQAPVVASKEIQVNAIVIEHVPVAELPSAWRAKLAQSPGAHVTVRIEEEAVQTTIAKEEFVTDDPLFGMWRDRDDMADVAAYVRHIRAPRFDRNGSRNEP